MTMRSSWVRERHGVELVELLAGGDEGNAAAGIADEGCDLLAGERGVDGNVGCSDGERGEVGNGPLPAIFGDEGDAVALLCSPGEQGLGQRADALIDLVRGDGLPLAKLVLPEDGAGVVGRRDAAKEVVDGGDGRDFSHLFAIGNARARRRDHTRVYQPGGRGVKWASR